MYLLKFVYLAIVSVLIDFVVTSQQENPLFKEVYKKCRMKQYSTEIGMPGVFDPACRKAVNLTRCEGRCKSSSLPILKGLEMDWEQKCKCCQPKAFREVVVHFAKCGGSLTYTEIQSCRCIPC